MTYKDAIEYAKRTNFCAGCPKSFGDMTPNEARECCNNCEHNNFFALAIEAFEKQIPKKPVDEKDDDFYHCPVCDMQIGTMQKYCERCGQKLDWDNVDIN